MDVNSVNNYFKINRFLLELIEGLMYTTGAIMILSVLIFGLIFIEIKDEFQFNYFNLPPF